MRVMWPWGPGLISLEKGFTSVYGALSNEGMHRRLEHNLVKQSLLRSGKVPVCQRVSLEGRKISLDMQTLVVSKGTAFLWVTA